MFVLQSLGEVEFGFVPRTVVSDLQDIGNWKVRTCSLSVGQAFTFLEVKLGCRSTQTIGWPGGTC